MLLAKSDKRNIYSHIIITIIDQCVIKHIMILPIETITFDLKVSLYTITSTASLPSGLTAMLTTLSQVLHLFLADSLLYTNNIITSTASLSSRLTALY